MADTTGPGGVGPSLDERTEIDSLHQRLGTITHYDLLGVARDADRTTVINAYLQRSRRFDAGAFGGPLGPYQAKVDEILRALEDARDVLTDSIRRFRYDQQLAARTTREEQSQGALPRSWRAAEASVLGNVPGVPDPGAVPTAPRRPSAPGFPPTRVPSPVGTPAVRSPGTAAQRAGTTPDPRRDTPSRTHRPHASQPSRRASSGTTEVAPHDTSHAPAGRPPATPAPGSSSTPAMTGAGNVEARLAALETQLGLVNRDLAAVVREVETLCTAFESCVPPDETGEPPGREKVARALQSVLSARATVATVMAEREERVGRWEFAAIFWQRAAQARPRDAMLLVHAADALRRGGIDLGTAESLARRAIEIDPDLAAAHAALAVIVARRG